MLNNKYIHSADIAMQIDATCIHEYQYPSLLLMEHAASQCVQIIENKIQKHAKIAILCGPGNNGSDGLAIARQLHHDGYDVFVSIPLPETMSKEEKVQFDMIQALDIQYSHDLDSIIKNIEDRDIIIDAIFGNGLSRDIKDDYEIIIHSVNQSKKEVYAIDIPSGIHATTGAILNCAIKADTTIVLDCFKEGHFIYPGKEYSGIVKLVDIGIPEILHKNHTHSTYIDKAFIKTIFPKRNDHSHKGCFSKVLMIGGSKEMPGAISLASKACARSGIGTLTIMEPDCIGDLLFSKTDFAMHIRCKDKDGHFDLSAINQLKKHIEAFDFITIGNGMQRNQETIELVKEVLESKKPCIIDADGLWALSFLKAKLKRKAEVILTPHIKEMSYLCDRSVEEILQSPFTVIKDFCKEYSNCTILLKSDITYIANKNETYVYSKSNSALAKGGSGDILCGILAGLYGHKISSIKAAVCAVYVHSNCVPTKKDPAYVTCEDLIDELNHVYQSLR